MNNLEELKKEIIDKVKNKFEIKQININFQDEFYYPKYIHLLKFNMSNTKRKSTMKRRNYKTI